LRGHVDSLLGETREDISAVKAFVVAARVAAHDISGREP
jgi:hypothetical protein